MKLQTENTNCIFHQHPPNSSPKTQKLNKTQLKKIKFKWWYVFCLWMQMKKQNGFSAFRAKQITQVLTKPKVNAQDEKNKRHRLYAHGMLIQLYIPQLTQSPILKVA